MKNKKKKIKIKDPKGVEKGVNSVEYQQIIEVQVSTIVEPLTTPLTTPLIEPLIIEPLKEPLITPLITTPLIEPLIIEPLKEPRRGVIIIAAGFAQYYQMALNLAVSLKVADPLTKVCLLYSGPGLNHVRNAIHLFDDVIEISEQFITRNGLQSFLRAKTCLYELSPYDETILIDADVVWSPRKKISDLFEELKNLEFTIGCRSRNDLEIDKGIRAVWTSVEELKEKHGRGGVEKGGAGVKIEAKMYNLSSEFIFFKKTIKVENFFKKVQGYFDDPQVEYLRFGGTVPDELAFQIAMMQEPQDSKCLPHQIPFLPFYWEYYEKKQLEPNKIYDRWYGYSMGGNVYTEQMKRIYSSLVGWYGSQYGVRTYPAQDKSKWNNLRTQI
jgi:hypothetical protein